MYKVLIAEDELLVRMGLKNSIHWSDHNMTIAAETSNGKEAWETYQRIKPDILITDLKMPVMDGMELVEKIREIDGRIKIVILTCLEEFGLARKAIGFGVSQYIPKLTMTFQEIEAVLSKVKAELDEIRPVDREDSFDAGSLVVKKSEALRNYFLYKEQRENDIQEFYKRQCSYLKPERLVVCVMEMVQAGTPAVVNLDENKSKVHSSFMDVLNQVMDFHKRGEVFRINDRRYAFLLSFFDKADEKSIRDGLDSILDQLKKMVFNYYNFDVYFGISQVKDGYASLDELFLQAAEMCDMMFFDSPGKSVFWDAELCETYRQRAEEKLLELLDKIDALNLIQRGERLEIDAYMNYMRIQKKVSGEQFIFIIVRLLFLITACKEIPESLKTRSLFLQTEKISGSKTLDEAIGIVLEFVAQIREAVKNVRVISREISEAIKYINGNYKKEIALQQMAAVVNLSPAYFSTLFKKEMDVTFTDYIIYVRIREAKNLLQETNRKIYEICESVGFSDIGYFSRTFKKITGISPNEFRKQIVNFETRV